MADKKISALTPAATPLAGTEVLPIVQSGATVQVANNDLRPKQIQSNATSGVLQVVGPAASTTRVMTTPNANFTAARTDAAQTFTGNNTFNGTTTVSAAEAYLGLNAAALGTGKFWYLISGGGGNVSPGYLSFFNATNGNKVISIAPSTTEQFVTDTSGNFNLVTGNLVIGTAGKGIDFSANGGDILSQYDEGTYTPVFTASSSNPTVTYGLQRGKYVRVGNSVTVSVFISWSALSGGSGDLQISLPFAGESSVGAGAAGAIADLTGFTFAAGRTFCSVRPNANVLYATFPQSGSAVSTSNTTVAQTASSGLIVFSCTYLI